MHAFSYTPFQECHQSLPRNLSFIHLFFQTLLILDHPRFILVTFVLEWFWGCELVSSLTNNTIHPPNPMLSLKIAFLFIGPLFPRICTEDMNENTN